jgi:hypothetical protein
VSGQRHASAALHPQERTPVPTGQEAGWAWRGLDTEARWKIHCLCRGSKLGYPPVCSQTLYWRKYSSSSSYICEYWNLVSNRFHIHRSPEVANANWAGIRSAAANVLCSSLRTVPMTPINFLAIACQTTFRELCGGRNVKLISQYDKVWECTETGPHSQAGPTTISSQQLFQPNVVVEWLTLLLLIREVTD